MPTDILFPYYINQGIFSQIQQIDIHRASKRLCVPKKQGGGTYSYFLTDLISRNLNQNPVSDPPRPYEALPLCLETRYGFYGDDSGILKYSMPG